MAISETKMQMVIANYFKDECDVNTSIRQAFEKGFRIGVKKGASTNRPQEWIPCSERLPNENGDYLVTLENGVVKILGYSTTQRTTYPKGFYHIEDGFSWRQVQNPVVAWMPLPEPWKGADDE